jgi:hypothetical protein
VVVLWRTATRGRLQSIRQLVSLGSSTQPPSLQLRPVPLQKAGTGVGRRPETLMPQPRWNRLQRHSGRQQVAVPQIMRHNAHTNASGSSQRIPHRLYKNGTPKASSPGPIRWSAVPVAAPSRQSLTAADARHDSDDASDKRCSLGFSPGTNISSSLKSPVFFRGWGRAGMLGLPCVIGVCIGQTVAGL